jgi:hypothetical protein
VAELLKERSRQELDEVRAMSSSASSFDEVVDRLRVWNTQRAEHLEGSLALRLELILQAIRTPRLRPLMAEHELLVRHATADGVAHKLALDNGRPPADVAFLGLIVQALEDGLLIQWVLSPDVIPEAVADQAVALLMRARSTLATSETSMT